MSDFSLTAEQKAAIEHGDGNVIVSAGAGSGKTFVMIERLIRLVREGKAGVDEILAVTFTNMAAAEMKEKLIKKLTEYINDPATDEQTRARLKAQLSLVPGASISTFHSFCKGLIKSYFYELGIDSAFGVASGDEAELLKSRAADELFDELYERGEGDMDHLLSVFSSTRSDGELKRIAVELYDFFDAEAYPEKAAENALENYTREGYLKIKAAYIAQYRADIKNYASKLNAVCKEFFAAPPACAAQISDMLERFSACESAEDLNRETAAEKPRIPKTKDFPPSAGKALKEICDAAYAEAENAAAAIGEGGEEDLVSMRRAAEGLVNLVAQLRERYSALKREENVLDFGDLEHFALALLNDPNICEAVAGGYKYIFADEYQDTNGVQEEILSKITRDNAFMVGDVKQCIYAFRGCNPKIFENKFREYSASGAALTLSRGFRSCDPVMDSVNAVFSAIMTDEICGTRYSLHPMSGGNGAEGGSAELHIAEKGKKADCTEKKGVYSVKAHLDGDVDDKVYYEGLLIASLIKEALARPVKIRERGESALKEKYLGYGDVVVLCRKNTQIEKIAEALSEADIPVTCPVRESITEYPEIKQLENLLRVIDNCRTDNTLFACMRGPFGKFTDAELAEIRRFSDRAGEEKISFCRAVSMCREKGGGELKQKLDAFFEFIEGLRFTADYEGAGRTLARAVREREVDLHYAAMRGGRQRILRMQKFIAEAGAQKSGVRDFLARLDRMIEPEGVPEAGGDDSVRIMTIHAGKGLEFPVVIIPGISADFTSKERTKINGRWSTKRVYTMRGLGFVMKTYNPVTRKVKDNLLYRYYKKCGAAQEVTEEERVLYVGMTRAMYKLYFTSASPKISERLTAADILKATAYAQFLTKNSMPVFTHTYDDLVAGASAARSRGPRSVLAAHPDLALKDSLVKNFSFVYPFDTSSPAKSSVTATLHAGEPSSPPVPAMFSEDDCARERGNAYHRFMELADFKKSAKSQLIAQKQEMLDSGKLSPEWAELVDVCKLENVLKDPFFSIDGARYFRELPFEVLVPANMIGGLGDDEVLLQGVIDVIAFAGDEAHIADYKVSSRDKASLAAVYAKQLELYAYAATRITGKKVVSKTLFNLMSGEKVPV